MTVGNQNIEMYAGDSRLIRATVYDLDQDPPVLLDMTGATVTWIVRKLLPPKTAIINVVDTDTELTITGLGTFEVAVIPEFTTRKEGKYEHQCRVVLPSGDKSTVFGGDFQVLRSLF